MMPTKKQGAKRHTGLEHRSTGLRNSVYHGNMPPRTICPTLPHPTSLALSFASFASALASFLAFPSVFICRTTVRALLIFAIAAWAVEIGGGKRLAWEWE